ncbi:MAG: M6 family metalloprotease domain-containing protein [Fibrobacter sp.]|nr:M6 family metalloprotease domain-containing protein [Fibrobacter sp.]
MRFFRITFLLLFFAVACLAQPLLNKNITIGDVRVPVILVQFDDVKFTHEDPRAFYTNFLNKEGFNEYGNVGSVRDYFVYNSMGEYRPSFDVYGPVTLPNTKDFYDTPVGNTAELMFSQALDSLLSQGTDFSAYDNYGNGDVEVIPMVYAGKRGGSNSNLWPALRELGLKVNDNFFVGRFSCVNEMDEITTFVHEFSHALGLPDVYVGAMLPVVETWSVMDDGNGKVPPLYMAFDRMLMGWLTPSELGNEEFIRLDKLDDNVAISITNPENEKEMYLLEYRTKKIWDNRQKNSGMLVWYVDYDDSAWTKKINDYRCHAREYIVRAKPSMMKIQNAGESCSYDAGPALPSDVFPGTGNVTSFDGFVFRNGLNMNITLSEITESEDKNYVTFKVSRSTPYKTEIESSSSSAFVVPHFSSASTDVPYSSTIIEIKDTLKPFESVIVPSIEVASRNQATIRNGMLHIRSGKLGEKTVRLFSLHGQLLFVTRMEGAELTLRLPGSIGEQRVLLSIIP